MRRDTDAQHDESGTPAGAPVDEQPLRSRLVANVLLGPRLCSRVLASR
jgi:hypothetical protein